MVERAATPISSASEFTGISIRRTDRVDRARGMGSLHGHDHVAGLVGIPIEGPPYSTGAADGQAGRLVGGTWKQESRNTANRALNGGVLFRPVPLISSIQRLTSSPSGPAWPSFAQPDVERNMTTGPRTRLSTDLMQRFR